ncbi:MAG TPA: RNA methyltransferase [Mycobacteriales bacterium]|nr:RNA methyltransferase [Mycobacteriales bacterium]
MKRKHRDSEHLFLAEGHQAVREALRRDPAGPGGVRALFVAPDAAVRHADLVHAADGLGVTVTAVDDTGMAGLSGTVTPQGIVAVCGYLDVPAPAALDPAPRLSAVLYEINDPGNAGTVLRTADAAGAAAVVFGDGSVDPYNGKCVRASAGSLFHPAVVRGADLAEVLPALRDRGVRVLAADGGGETDLDGELDSGRLAEPTAWLFGNEARGLPPDVAVLADARVRIPIHGGAESLNLAAAAAVCLYASARAQRRGPAD